MTTIFLVNEHMRKTKGDREPPEHGLKKYWRRNAKVQKTSAKICSGNVSVVKNSPSELTFVPSEEELLSMGTEVACTLVRIFCVSVYKVIVENNESLKRVNKLSTIRVFHTA